MLCSGEWRKWLINAFNGVEKAHHTFTCVFVNRTGYGAYMAARGHEEGGGGEEGRRRRRDNVPRLKADAD